jgi:hypothetical protein
MIERKEIADAFGTDIFDWSQFAMSDFSCNCREKLSTTDLRRYDNNQPLHQAAKNIVIAACIVGSIVGDLF